MILHNLYNDYEIILSLQLQGFTNKNTNVLKTKLLIGANTYLL